MDCHRQNILNILGLKTEKKILFLVLIINISIKYFFVSIMFYNTRISFFFDFDIVFVTVLFGI